MVAAPANTEGNSKPIVLLADYRDSLAHSLRQSLGSDQYELYFCSTLEAIDRFLADTTPHLLVVGSLLDASCLEVQRLYGNKTGNVIILVDDTEVNPFFREWVKKKGVYEVISITAGKFRLLLDVIERALFGTQGVAQDKGKETELYCTYEDALLCLQEISQVSLQYFGPLAIGNYWKKAKATIADREWQDLWSIDHNGRIGLVGGQKSLRTKLTEREFALLQTFVRGFMGECERIIKDYTKVVQPKLSHKTAALLSIVVNQ
ncbi:MAG: hypothetical protein RMK91_04525 [Pseudanabaenaceae cyanobacterium SKYGB_i_bin29]|nr:hypothetical protein [Pseudanabaenaceae cyanobacterium SKYG29]MDW8421109.1 hypothetical protein [Pseudanabaenaceae cyanobacterium SKYGB_i_bin29]